MRILKIGVILCGVIILQTTVLPYLRIKEAGLDLVLILIVYTGLYLSISRATLFGFLGGLAEDIFSGFLLGSNALSKTLIGFLTASLERKIYKENFIMQAILVFLATILNGIIFSLIFLAFRTQSSVGKHWWAVIVPGAFYNSLVGPLLFFIIKWIERHPRFHQ